ncbi:MAG TPA: TldD/PmbA family protein [Nannocystaceae bacterium]|nr:TldD/PmbA family protein [Nannocystaceae bacterium]
MSDELQRRAAAAVELAKSAGADDVWATVYAERNTECSTRDGQLEQMSENSSRSLGLRLWVDGRYSSHDTNDLREANLRAFVRDAVALTRAIEPDPLRRMPDPKRFGSVDVRALDLEDVSLAKLDVDARLELCRSIDARASGKPGVISASAQLMDGRIEHAVASSNGFTGGYASTFVAAMAAVSIADGDERPEGGMNAAARHRADLPELTWIGDQALANARARIGAKPGKTGKGIMLVDRRAAADLVAMLLGPASADSLQQGRSMWAERIGKRVLAKELEIVDDPLIPRGLGSRPFDDEGVAAMKRTIVSGGTLRTIFAGSYYAAKLGVEPTTESNSNLVLVPGKGDVHALAANIRDGIYVTGWLGGNADDTTGDFSMGMIGHRIRKGEIAEPLGEMNVSGNLLQLFAHLEAIGDDVWRYNSLHTPSLVFDRVSFSGA